MVNYLKINMALTPTLHNDMLIIMSLMRSFA